jgi:tetratricopeptide (TPR) repeat protein
LPGGGDKNVHFYQKQTPQSRPKSEFFNSLSHKRTSISASKKGGQCPASSDRWRAFEGHWRLNQALSYIARCFVMLLAMRHLIVMAAGWVLASPSAADFESDRRDCIRGTGRIATHACSRLLTSKRILRRERGTIFYNRGNAFRRLDMYRRVIRDYGEALRINPDHAPSFNNRGNAYRRLKQYRRAIEDYNAALRLDPQLASAYYNWGNAYLNLKQFRRAITDYDEFVRRKPGTADAHNNRAWAYYKLDKSAQGLADANRALRLNPGNPYVLDTRAHIYEALGRRNEAIRDFREALRQTPDLVSSRVGLRRLRATP